MPLVNLKLIEGVFSQDQKQEMIRRVTDVMSDLEGEHMRPVTVVIIEEVKSGDLGICGKAISRADVKAMAERESRKFCLILTTYPKSPPGSWKHRPDDWSLAERRPPPRGGRINANLELPCRNRALYQMH